MSTKPKVSFLEIIRHQGNKQYPDDFFNQISFKEVLKVIKNDLYESGTYPHVDPTPGNAGYCQLIAGFLDRQIQELNALDLEKCDEEATRSLQPLAKAFILQESYCPKKYEALSPKLVIQKLSSLGLIKEEISEEYLKYIDLNKKKKDSLSLEEKEFLSAHKRKNSLSNRKAEDLMERIQESFMQDIFSSTQTSKDTAREVSMELAMDIIHKSDSLIHFRFYNGTPGRPDIFSSVATPYFGNIYKHSLDEPEKWIKLSNVEIAKLLYEDDRKNIIQVHFEYQEMLSGYFIELLKEKPEIKSVLIKNEKSERVNGVKDFFGFGEPVFNLREFAMRGLSAINNIELEFSNPKHPVTGPCHFSVVPGIKNLAILSSIALIDEKDPTKGFSQKDKCREDFLYAPLKIQRYISHCYNDSKDNPITWRLRKKFKGFDVELGLAYDETNSALDSKFCFVKIEEDIGDKSVIVRDRARILEIYHELIHSIVRPLTKPGYLYPQARFLLNQARITEDTIDEMLEDSFKNNLTCIGQRPK